MAIWPIATAALAGLAAYAIWRGLRTPDSSTPYDFGHTPPGDGN